MRPPTWQRSDISLSDRDESIGQVSPKRVQNTIFAVLSEIRLSSPKRKSGSESVETEFELNRVRRDKAFLAMSTADSLSLLDWTSRQCQPGKSGWTQQQLAALFERLEVNAEIWCCLVRDLGKLFSIVAGQPHRIDDHRSKTVSHRCRVRPAGGTCWPRHSRAEFSSARRRLSPRHSFLHPDHSRRHAATEVLSGVLSAVPQCLPNTAVTMLCRNASAHHASARRTRKFHAAARRGRSLRRLASGQRTCRRYAGRAILTTRSAVAVCRSGGTGTAPISAGSLPGGR